jgi:serine/threonine-protein kinase RIO1
MNKTFFKYLGLIIGAAIIPASTSAQTPNSYYNIVAAHSGKCAEVYGASQDNAAVISQGSCLDQDNLKWSLVSVGNGYYFIKAKHSGKCAEVYGASQDNAAVISQWDCEDQDNVKWLLVKK